MSSCCVVDSLHVYVCFLAEQTAKEYCEQLGVDVCIKLFEQFKSYEGLYFFLGSFLSSSSSQNRAAERSGTSD